MQIVDPDDYIREEEHFIYLKRKALDERNFIGSEDPNSPSSLRIDDIQPGNWTAVKGRHIDHNDVLLYASCGDRNKAHLSPEFARKSPFGEIIAHGMIAVFKQRLLGRRILPGMNFVLAQQKKAFTAPVYVSTSVLDFYELVLDVDRRNHRVTTLGMSVLNNEYDKIVLKTESTYVPLAIFHIEDGYPEAGVMASLESADPALEVRFAEPGEPNHFSHDFFRQGQWARLCPNLRKNHLYALAGIGHMEGKLHLFDELYGKAEFLVPCADDAFRSAVIGTLLPGMGSIYRNEETWFLKPLKLGELESRILIEELEESSRAVSLGLSAYTTQDGELMSASRTRVYFPRPVEGS